MKKIILDNPYEDLSIFDGINNMDIFKALNCLSGIEKSYKKDELIVRIGEKVNHIRILLKGHVYLYNLNSFGERNIISELKRGDLISGSIVFSKDDNSPYGAVCIDDCKVLNISSSQIKTAERPRCGFTNIIMKNLLFMIAEENNSLRNKLNITSIKSLREKIFNYLYLQASINNKNSFKIPFVNRADFADYLGVNCSALSRELGRMRDEEILDFHKNKFTLKRYPEER